MFKPTPRLCSNRRCAIGKDDHLVVGNLHVAALDFVALHGAALCRRQADLAISQHGHQRSVTARKPISPSTPGTTTISTSQAASFSAGVTMSHLKLAILRFFLLHFLVSSVDVVDAALQAEALLGDLVALAVEDGGEGTDGVLLPGKPVNCVATWKHWPKNC